MNATATRLNRLHEAAFDLGFVTEALQFIVPDSVHSLLLDVPYPVWSPRYSNETFDRAQSLASQLTDSDREAGRPAPVGGYSLPRFNQARAAVRAAVK